MKLIEIINIIIDTAKSLPNIGTIYEGSVYDLNALPNVRYSTIVITQGEHSVNDNYSDFNFKIFYVDKLMNDESNRLQIQSNGMLILQNLINKIQNDNDEIECGALRFTTFTHKFADNCAGVWANVNIITNNSLNHCSY